MGCAASATAHDLLPATTPSRRASVAAPATPTGGAPTRPSSPPLTRDYTHGASDDALPPEAAPGGDDVLSRRNEHLISAGSTVEPATRAAAREVDAPASAEHAASAASTAAATAATASAAAAAVAAAAAGAGAAAAPGATAPRSRAGSDLGAGAAGDASGAAAPQVPPPQLQVQSQSQAQPHRQQASSVASVSPRDKAPRSPASPSPTAHAEHAVGAAEVIAAAPAPPLPRAASGKRVVTATRAPVALPSVPRRTMSTNSTASSGKGAISAQVDAQMAGERDAALLDTTSKQTVALSETTRRMLPLLPPYPTGFVARITHVVSLHRVRDGPPGSNNGMTTQRLPMLAHNQPQLAQLFNHAQQQNCASDVFTTLTLMPTDTDVFRLCGRFLLNVFLFDDYWEAADIDNPSSNVSVELQRFIYRSAHYFARHTGIAASELFRRCERFCKPIPKSDEVDSQSAEDVRADFTVRDTSTASTSSRYKPGDNPFIALYPLLYGEQSPFDAPLRAQWAPRFAVGVLRYLCSLYHERRVIHKQRMDSAYRPSVRRYLSYRGNVGGPEMFWAICGLTRAIDMEDSEYEASEAIFNDVWTHVCTFNDLVSPEQDTIHLVMLMGMQKAADFVADARNRTAAAVRQLCDDGASWAPALMDLWYGMCAYQVPDICGVQRYKQAARFKDARAAP